MLRRCRDISPLATAFRLTHDRQFVEARILHASWGVSRPGSKARELLFPSSVASIRVGTHLGKRVITLRGRLAATDLGRLERACGPALEYRNMPLELRLGAVSSADDAARAFLDLLVRRGAVVRAGNGVAHSSSRSSVRIARSPGSRIDDD